MKSRELILNELDYLVKSTYFKKKRIQRRFLQHFLNEYRKANEIVPIKNQDLVAIYERDTPEIEHDGDRFIVKKNAVSKHIGKLRENLRKFYRGPGKVRPHILTIPENEPGNYSLDIMNRQHKKGFREEPFKRVKGNVLPLSGMNDTRPALRPQSVNETIFLALKGISSKHLIQIQRVARGIMWASSLIGVAILIVLLVGIPHWPGMPLMGLSLAGLLLICTSIAILSRPISQLGDVPFGRWWGNTFCLYRGEALALARYSGRCVVNGCQGELSIVQEPQERVNLFHMLPRRWLIVCKNVPTEHPRTPLVSRDSIKPGT
ncbi:MAG: hypothetical protein ABIN58_00375 [candidate division WOR-3 bacterium]|jgi:hypothetical protein